MTLCLLRQEQAEEARLGLTPKQFAKYSLLRLECGTDMTKFPTEKHFCAWLGVAPKHEISGNKVLKNTTLKTKNRAGQAFRMAAQSVKQADCAFGVLYRRLRARLGPSQATVATAHAIARVVYRMLKYKVEYDPLT